MATKGKIVNTSDSLEVTPERVLNIAVSTQLLPDTAKTEQGPAD
jgi:hypothetical protein